MLTLVAAILSSLVLAKHKIKTRPTLRQFIDNYTIPSLLSYVKALLEQGDPIVAPLWNTPKRNTIVGGATKYVLRDAPVLISQIFEQAVNTFYDSI